MTMMMTRLFLHLVGLTLLVLAPMISSAKDADHGKSQIRGRDNISIPRRLQISDDGDSYGEGSVSPTASPSATSSPATSMTTSTCSNGISGIESSNGLACCVVGCGQCGGVGCSTVGLPEYDADDCCSTEIVDFGMSCSVTGTAPCYINDDEAVCSNGVDGVESADGTICCASGCDECSEDACSLSYDFGTDSENDCCSSDVASIGELCDSTGVSPCIISEVASTCSNGITGIESSNGEACCVAACGQCGGVGCSTAGLPNYDAYDCCVTEIVDYGMSCSVTGSAPCYIDESQTTSSDTPTPTTSAMFTSSSFTMSPTVTETASCIETYTYVGCYSEMAEDPFYIKYASVNMTTQACFTTCSGENAIYMGLMSGNECGCGENGLYLVLNKTEGSCTTACSGDAELTCGGPLSFDLYTISEICD